MKVSISEILSKVSLIIFSFLIIYFAYIGINSKVIEGDSLAYHIPISNLILNGGIINPAIWTYPTTTDIPRLYQPGSNEIILSIIRLLGIPINLFDLFGVLFLFFSLYVLAKSYEFDKYYSILFSSTISSLHTIIRWINTQTIDVWLVSFFVLLIYLLRKPEKKLSYFILLGLVSGMLFGGKYTGPAYFFILFVIFARKIFFYVNIKRFIGFIIPFLALGLSWYIRNLILTGDPYYPQPILFFKAPEYHILDEAVWKMFFYFNNAPITWINSMISEYTIWSLSIIIAPFVFIYNILKKKSLNKEIKNLILVSLFCFIVYLFLPSGPSPSLFTSVLRYTYPAMIPLILIIFLYAKFYSRKNLISVIAVTNMLILPEISYHPKILLLLIPISVLIFYPLEIKDFYQFYKKKYTRKSI